MWERIQEIMKLYACEQLAELKREHLNGPRKFLQFVARSLRCSSSANGNVLLNFGRHPLGYGAAITLSKQTIAVACADCEAVWKRWPVDPRSRPRQLKRRFEAKRLLSWKTRAATWRTSAAALWRDRSLLETSSSVSSSCHRPSMSASRLRTSPSARLSVAQ